jgi:hypothetical protein
MAADVTPRFSHGGDGSDGTQIGNGSPIFLGDNCVAASMFIEISGGTATVFYEVNGGPIANGVPQGQWVDVTGGSGYALTTTTPVAKTCPVDAPYHRTRISAIDPGASVRSYCPGIRTGNGDWINAVRPPNASPPNLS